MKLRLHVGKVIHPFALARTVIKCIGVGVDPDAFNLPVDYTGYKVFQVSIATGKRYVGPYLGGGVAEPHGINVSRDYKCVRPAILLAEVNRCVKGVGKTVAEQP